MDHRRIRQSPPRPLFRVSQRLSEGRRHLSQERPRARLVLQTSHGARIPLELDDRPGVQTWTLTTPVEAQWLKFVIDDGYPGSRYTDTALSKLTVNSERIR